MKIVYQKQLVPPHLVHRNQIIDSLLKRPQRLIVIEVADMLADEGLAIDDQRNCILEIGAHSENGTFHRKRGNRARCVSPRPSQNSWPVSARARYRVVHATSDRPLAHQK